MIGAVNQHHSRGGILEVLTKGQPAKTRAQNDNVFAVHPEGIFRDAEEIANDKLSRKKIKNCNHGWTQMNTETTCQYT